MYIHLSSTLCKKIMNVSDEHLNKGSEKKLPLCLIKNRNYSSVKINIPIRPKSFSDGNKSYDLYNVTLEILTQHLSRVMRKPTFCICENNDADQLHGNPEADQRLCFRYMDSTIPLLSKSKISSL